jgi:oxalate decarboxylase/phosphoglucose isomerase-like protein (cupin superfamily)
LGDSKTGYLSTIPKESTMRVGGDELIIHVSSEQTGGALLVGEVGMPAGGGPPHPHRHDATEVYRVDDGELAIYLEDDAGELQRHLTGPGEVVHIPGGRAHTIRNESAAAARAYVVFSPGAAMEAFVREAAVADRPEQVRAAAQRHGITF